MIQNLVVPHFRDSITFSKFGRSFIVPYYVPITSTIPGDEAKAANSGCIRGMICLSDFGPGDYS